MMRSGTHPDHPLATQTAAPPAVPPRRPIVGVAMADDDERAQRLQDSVQLLQLAHEATQAAIARVAARANRDRWRDLSDA